MAITTPPPPPNSGNPAQFNERADGFLGWFPTFVSDFNADLPLLRGRTYATRAGTANAIVLTTGGVALAVGMQVRWRAAATNTGAVTINVDGQGVIEARTITNVALPAGYIRTDADTVATYDGTRWIVDRQMEFGSNANGDFTRLADGRQICSTTRSIGGISSATGAVFRSSPEHVWTFPSSFFGTEGLFVSANPRESSGISWGRGRTLSTTQGGIFLFSSVSIGGTLICETFATGRWY